MRTEEQCYSFNFEDARRDQDPRNTSPETKNIFLFFRVDLKMFYIYLFGGGSVVCGFQRTICRSQFLFQPSGFWESNSGCQAWPLLPMSSFAH